MRVLLVTPPMSDLNTPYPATAFLTGYLRSRGVDCEQRDWSLDLACRLFSADGLDLLRGYLLAAGPETRVGTPMRHFLERFDDYRRGVEPAVGFLQGRQPSLDMRLASRTLLPEGERTRRILDNPDTVSRFGRMGVADLARLIASLFVGELAEVFRAVDPLFQLTSYGPKLATAPAFDTLLDQLAAGDTLITATLEQIIRLELATAPPDLLGVTIPFPGNLYGALRICRYVRREFPAVKIALGGGFVNTDLRKLSDPRVFDCVDYITLDDGYRPFEAILEFLAGTRTEGSLLRTFRRCNGRVEFVSSSAEADVPFRELPPPTYRGLALDRYLSLCTGLSPVHRVWASNWNKLILAHGCYWRKCAFCDVSLDYISRYEPLTAARLVDHVESLLTETGNTGFHWVDEAAPPGLLRSVSQQLLERGLVISWWGMLRFEKSFDSDLPALLARAGCVMVSGGIEVASDRLLRLMKKGVSISQVARVTRRFSAAGILVHAFLMYGFPSETVQETIDSLEVVRQLFLHGCIHSGFWHRFVATVHSPVGQHPDDYGVRLLPAEEPAHGTFAHDVVDYFDPVAADHDMLGRGLAQAVARYREGLDLHRDLRDWFDAPVPVTTIAPDLIEGVLAASAADCPDPAEVTLRHRPTVALQVLEAE